MSGFDYGFLQELDVTEKTAEFRLPGTNIKLTIRPATKENKKYFNELAKTVKRNLNSGKDTTDLLEEQREEDRELYAKHVIVGWNLPVEFSQAECIKFMAELPAYPLDKLRDFASSQANFLQSIIDVETLGKN